MSKTRNEAWPATEPSSSPAYEGEYGLVFQLDSTMRADVNGDKLTIVLRGESLDFAQEGGSLVTKLERAGIKGPKAERMVERAFADLGAEVAFRAVRKHQIR